MTLNATKPRTFTRVELTSTITTGAYNAMSAEDREAFDRQLFDLWAGDYSAQTTRDNAWDAEASARGVIEP